MECVNPATSFCNYVMLSAFMFITFVIVIIKLTCLKKFLKQKIIKGSMTKKIHMKRTIYIKKALLLVSFVISVLIIASCDNRQRSSDIRDVAQEGNEARFDDNKQEKDAQFLVNAAEMNLKQIQLGELAQQKGNTAHVKELGK